jgi:hypothetical protein
MPEVPDTASRAVTASAEGLDGAGASPADDGSIGGASTIGGGIGGKSLMVLSILDCAWRCMRVNDTPRLKRSQLSGTVALAVHCSGVSIRPYFAGC